MDPNVPRHPIHPDASINYETPRYVSLIGIQYRLVLQFSTMGLNYIPRCVTSASIFLFPVGRMAIIPGPRIQWRPATTLWHSTHLFQATVEPSQNGSNDFIPPFCHPDGTDDHGTPLVACESVNQPLISGF